LNQSQLSEIEDSLPQETECLMFAPMSCNELPVPQLSPSSHVFPSSSEFEFPEDMITVSNEQAFCNLNHEVNISGSLNCIGMEQSLDNACNDINENLSWKQEDEIVMAVKEYPVHLTLEENDVQVECSGIQHYTLEFYVLLMTNLQL